MIRVTILMALMASALTCSAEDLAERLAARPNVAVAQPAALRSRLARVGGDAADAADGQAAEPTATHTAGGYRVQVFSDNNPRTAKNEAHSKAAAIREAFPQWATYITYDSPYWRLRVGDFRTYDDATHAVVELKNAFPAYRRELRVVRDRIKVTD